MDFIYTYTPDRTLQNWQVTFFFFFAPQSTRCLHVPQFHSIGPMALCALMSSRCVYCDELNVWDDTVGSSVCTSCGSLADPSQSVLTSLPNDWPVPSSLTLKTVGSGNNWDLSGQGKEARDRRHAVRNLSLFYSISS